MRDAPTQISTADIERVMRGLGDAPRSAYTAPHVYPWALRNFKPRPCAERPHPLAGELRLYVHIPFCNYRCTFCFYAVRVASRRAEMERYVAALERELEWIEPGTVLFDVFVGGGTPTALPADLLARVLERIAARTRSSGGRPHTVEASPESITEAHVRALREQGVGRVSMGIESLDDAVLGTVHRRHTREQALDACRRIIGGGLELNVDLIYGLPGQSHSSFRRDLEAVTAAGVDSVCCYALRLNRDTAVARQLADDERLDIERVIRWRSFVTAAAAECGFDQTRCYQFTRSGASARSRRAPAPPFAGYQLGVGMSARSQLGSAVYRNHDRLATYLERVEGAQSPVDSVFEMSVDDRKTQFIATYLGNGRALERAAYHSAFGIGIDEDFQPTLERLRGGDLIDDDGKRIALTETGKLVYDRILLCFYPEPARQWLSAPPA
jgi:oxygen-independent coproporphyrinogen-3 oxidase